MAFCNSEEEKECETDSLTLTTSVTVVCRASLNNQTVLYSTTDGGQQH